NIHPAVTSIALRKQPPLRAKSPAGPVAVLLLATIVAACAGKSEAAINADSLPVIAELPHDAEAYTQGFVFHDGFFFESTGLNGSSSLRKVDIESGAVREQADLDSVYFGEGLAVLGDRAYQLTWRNRVAFVYDVAAFELLDSFPLPGEGWGLTTDGTHLILSDGTYRLRFL